MSISKENVRFLGDKMGRNTVLFVDDDIHILSALKRGLIGEDYKITLATNGEKALEIMKKNKIGVIVTDMKMPGMDGLRLLKIIKDKYPDIVKIVLTGYTQLPQILATVNQVDVFRIITKPWDLEDELKPIIRQALGFYDYSRKTKRESDALKKQNLFLQNTLRATEKKFLQNKKDFSDMGDIIGSVFKSLKSQTKGKSPSEEVTELGILQVLLVGYLKTLPTNIIDFSPSKLQIDLTEWLNKIGCKDWIEIRTGTFDGVACKGNYKQLLFILISIIKHVIPHIQRKGVGLSFDVQKNILILNLTISKYGDREFSNITVNKTLLDFLVIVCEKLDSTMKIKSFSDFTLIEFNMPFVLL